MTAHKIFDGAFVMYSDMHLKECVSHFQSSTGSSLLYIGFGKNAASDESYQNKTKEDRICKFRFQERRRRFQTDTYLRLIPGMDSWGVLLEFPTV